MTGSPDGMTGQAADRPMTALEYRPMECSPKNADSSLALTPNQSHNTRQSASANGPAWDALKKHRLIHSVTESALCGPRREWRSVATTQNLQVNLTKRMTHVTGAG